MHPPPTVRHWTCRKNAGRKKKVFMNIQEGEKSVGMARQRWLDEAVNSLKKMGFRGWRKIARDSDVCKLILLEAMILCGMYSR